MPIVDCPECRKQISDAATSCPHCGYPLRPAAEPTQAPLVMMAPAQKWNPGIAALLSLVIPGAGQMYKGQVFNGLVWLFFVVVGYLIFIVPGLILHLFCIIGAASGDPKK